MNNFRLYIRHAHIGVQLVILLCLTLLGLSLLSSIGLLAAETFYNAGLDEINAFIADPSLPGAAGPLKALQLFTSLGLFLVPAMLFSQVYSNRPEQFLQLNTKPAGLAMLLTVVLIIVFTPITDGLTWLNNQLSLPGFLTDYENELRQKGSDIEQLLGSYLAMDNFGDFAYNIFLLAILPAFAEEFFFRGVLQELLIRHTKRVHLAVWVTGFAFAIMHGQLFAILPLCVLGAVLGYLKVWSGSLWLSIIAHFVNNASIVIIMYFFNYNLTDLEKLSTPSIWLVIGGMALSGGILFWFIKHKKPLANPADDFIIEEPEDHSGI